MTFFTNGADYTKDDLDNATLGDVKTSFMDSLGASVRSGAEEMPVTRLGAYLEHTGERLTGNTIPADEANKTYGIPGVLSFDKPVSDSLAGSLHDAKRDQILRDATIQAGPQNLAARVTRSVAGAIPSFLDPVGVAATFVPGLGEERMAAMIGNVANRATQYGLTRTGGMLASAAEKSGALAETLSSSIPGKIAQGVSQGATGMAVLEPVNYLFDQDEHNDWSMGQALGNIAFGGLLGGGLHGAGALLERRMAARADAVDGSADTPPTPNATISRLDAAGPEARGQVLGESIASMAGDRPSNAETLLHINELENTRRDLDRYMAEHGNAAPDADAGAQAPPMRDRMADDLSSLQQKHADTLAEAAIHEPPPEEEPTPSPAAQVTQPKEEPSDPSLFTFLTRHGGVMDEGGELKASDMHRQRIGMVRKQGGMSLDRARERAEEHGYLRSGSDINDLLHAMTEESHGRKVYPDGAGPRAHPAHDAELEEHHRERAADDVDEAAHAGDLSLSPEEHGHATDAVLDGLHPDAAIEEALRVSRHSTWDRYSTMLDHGRNLQQERLSARQEMLGALTRQRLGLYARHLDSGTDGLELYDMAASILESDNPKQAIEEALQAIERESGKGHDPAWQDEVQAVYQAAQQRLGKMQEGAAEDILRNLHGYEDHETATNRAGLSARKEGSPSPAAGQDATPLPTSGIEHLNVADVGENPALMGHMPDGVEGAPAWPLLIGDGEHIPQLDAKGRDIGGGHGRLHIEARHGDAIRSRGFASIDDFLRKTLADTNQVRLDEKNGSFFTISMGEKQGSKHKHPTIVMHLIKKDGYYRIATADEFKTGYLKNRKLLWEKDLSTNSNPTGPGSDSFNPRGQDTSGTPRSGRDDERHSSSSNNENPGPQSQDKSISEAQAYASRIDQRLAALGEEHIDPEALSEIQKEQDMADGNADALSSATSCLTRKV